MLIDTSVWVQFIRFGNPQLHELLRQNRVLMHDMVLGEVACGSLPGRTARLEGLNGLPHIPMAEHHEVLEFINRHALFGRGMGYVDNHLLAAVSLHSSSRLWSHDKRLQAAAVQLGIAFAQAVH